MPSPPIVRLSQALYSDVPAQSFRKRSFVGSSNASAADSPAETLALPSFPVVRLLLPRTFAVADCAYRDSLVTGVGGTSRESNPGASSNVAGREHDRNGSGSSSGSNPSAATSSRSAPDCNSTGTGQLQSSCPTRLPARGVAALVVVESILGFSAVCGLLDRSHAAAAAAAATTAANSLPSSVANTAAGHRIDLDEPPPPGGGSSNCCATSNGCSRQDAAAYDDGDGVREAVGRLVDWLLIAAAAVGTFSPGGSSGEEVGNAKTGPAPRAARKARRAADAVFTASVGLDVDDDSELLTAAAAGVAAAHGQARGTLCEARGCEGVAGWRAFDISPTGVGALGLAGGQPIEGGGSAHSGTGGVLEIRLICHPLVTMVPDIRWCLRLIGQAKAFATLLNANAKLSTLGGGYFLTRQVGQAIRLAQAQAEVATALGDLQLAGKCRINVAYNYIWLGQYAEAQRIIRAQVAASRAINDEDLENVASIAWRFLRRSRKANRRLLLEQGRLGAGDGESAAGGCGGGGDSCGGGTKNDLGQGWVRQRIDVKTDEWHRVRALPMYCSSGRATPVGWGGEANRGRQSLL